MTDPKRNIINGRHIYFTSLFADTPEDDDNPRQTKFFEKYDEYLEVQLQKHVIDRMKLAAVESKSYSVNPKLKFGKDIQKLVQKNCFLYEALEKENKQFLQYLHDKDEWEKKVADYTTRYKNIISEEAENVEQSSIERSKLKAEQSIKKKRNKALMLEELSKSLLVCASTETNVDYLQDESIRDIFFTDKC